MTSFGAATAVIDRAIENAEGPLPPPFLVEFLLGPWRRFLAAIHHDEGSGSRAWELAQHATELLLWSIAPKATEAEKTALGNALKALVEAVRRAMDVAAWDSSAQSVFLRQLREWHLQLIKRETPAPPPDAKLPPLGEVPRQPADPGAPADLADTVHLDVTDPHYRAYLEMLNHAIMEKIEL
ncbi:MAG: DUF1631 family protein [Gammaproteobacteria bacterium]|nr:DUF1631 family protein [Gammaproteobacteria bacterium]MCG3143452.1 hypothetical protein [Gammaproteobacteria bacterium]